MSTSTWWSASQHPEQVAQACRHLIERDATKASTVSIARAVLADHLPPVWDLTGQFVPHALHQWARYTIRYVREPRVEWVASLAHTVSHGCGDCDDLTVAIGTIAHSVGVPTWVCWRWVGPSFAHVFCGLGPTWLPGFEATAPTWNVDPFHEEISPDFGPQVHLLRCTT